MLPRSWVVAVDRNTLHGEGSDHRKYHTISAEERIASYLRELEVAMENWILILPLSSLCRVISISLHRWCYLYGPQPLLITTHPQVQIFEIIDSYFCLPVMCSKTHPISMINYNY